MSIDLDNLARQATADPPTRIPSLADLRRRAAQRRRRRTIARLAVLPAVIVAALGTWTLIDTDPQTETTVAGQADTTTPAGTAQDRPSTATPGQDVAPAADEPPGADPADAPVDDPEGSGPLGSFVWPAPPRNFATLDELVEQFAVEVLESAAGSVDYLEATDEQVPQSFLISHFPGPESSELHGHEVPAIAIPSPQGWGFVRIGAVALSIDETETGSHAIRFGPPHGTAASTVEVRYSDGEVVSEIVQAAEFALPEGRSPDSVVSVLVTHLDDAGKQITVSGRQFSLSVEEIEAEIEAREAQAVDPVPDLVGLTVSEALDLLREHEYHLAGVAFDEAPDAEPGTVIATSPAAGGLIEAYGSITLSIAGGGPSQSPEDAARDQIVPELAALPLGVRVHQADDWAGPTIVETTAGIWILSRMDSDLAFTLTESTGCGFGATEDPEAVYGRDVVCLLEYTEILLLDSQSGEILRAYPFSGAIPRQLLRTDDALYCIGQSDGGLANSLLCRIDLATLEPAVRIFPRDGSEYDWSWVPRGWTIDDPVGVVLWENLAVSDSGITISGHSGTATIDPQTLELLSIELDE